jgi:hypothetical protein
LLRGDAIWWYASGLGLTTEKRVELYAEFVWEVLVRERSQQRAGAEVC